MLEINDNHLFILNLVLALWLLFKLYRSYREGFLEQVINLLFGFCGFWLVLLLLPIVGKIRIFPLQWENSLSPLPFLAHIMGQAANQVLWIIVIFVGVFVVRLCCKPLTKSIRDMFIIGKIDRILGLILGLLNCFIILISLSFLTTLPLVKNGQNIRQHTILGWGNSFHRIVKMWFPHELQDLHELLNNLENKQTHPSPERLALIRTLLLEHGVTPEQVEKIIQEYVHP